MYVATQVSEQTSEKLSKASIRKRMYPWDDNVIDWSIPIDDQHLYMPEEHSLFYGTPMWERFSLEEKSFVTRWQFTQMMRNAGVGEHMLNMGILALLYKTKHYDPAWRFMLHEVAEECQHMAMFNEWCRLNKDITTHGVAGEYWGLPVSMLVPVVSTQFTVGFWMAVMLFEVIGEEVLNAAARDKGKLIHPIVKQIAQAHKVEEARHIYFAREWIDKRWPELNRPYRYTVSKIAETVLGFTLRSGIPFKYSKQLEPYVSYEEFKSAFKTRQRRELINLQFAPTIYEMNEINIIRDKTIRKWESEGIIWNKRGASIMSI